MMAYLEADDNDIITWNREELCRVTHGSRAACSEPKDYGICKRTKG